MEKSKDIEIRIGSASDVGRQRTVNEDSFCAFVPPPGSKEGREFQAVLGVADGMGGHQAGDAASRIIMDALSRAFIHGEFRDRHPPEEDWLHVMEYEVTAVHHRLHEVSRRRAEMRETGSTLTLGIFRKGILYLAHIGDSRCYRIRDQAITPLTRDHTWVENQVRAGVFTREEARHHPRKNVLTQAVGFDEFIEPQMLREQVSRGDRFLFCSDGLTHMLEDSEIRDLIHRRTDPQRACDGLVEMANLRGGPDNITALIGAVF